MRGQVWHPGGHTEAPRGGTPHPNPLPQREREYGVYFSRLGLILTRQSRNQEACYNPSPQGGALRGTPWGSH